MATTTPERRGLTTTTVAAGQPPRAMMAARSISENGSPSGKAASRAQGSLRLAANLKPSRASLGLKPSLNAQPRRPTTVAQGQPPSNTTVVQGSGNHSLLSRVLENGFKANRSASVDSSARSPLRGAGGRSPKGKRGSVEDFDAEGNKENVAPFRVVALASPPRALRRRGGAEKTRAVRIYSDALVASTAEVFGGLSIKSPRLHVVSVSDSSDSESDDALGMGLERGSLPGSSPLRMTRAASDAGEGAAMGKVVFRISKAAMQTTVGTKELASSDEESDVSGDSRRSSVVFGEGGFSGGEDVEGSSGCEHSETESESSIGEVSRVSEAGLA